MAGGRWLPWDSGRGEVQFSDITGENVFHLYKKFIHTYLDSEGQYVKWFKIIAC